MNALARTPRLADILRKPAVREALQATAAAQLDAGHSPEDVADDVAAVLDALLPFDLLVPGVGIALEAVDGIALRAIARAIVHAVQATQNRQRAHQKRHHRDDDEKHEPAEAVAAPSKPDSESPPF